MLLLRGFLCVRPRRDRYDEHPAHANNSKDNVEAASGPEGCLPGHAPGIITAVASANYSGCPAPLDCRGLLNGLVESPTSANAGLHGALQFPVESEQLELLPPELLPLRLHNLHCQQHQQQSAQQQQQQQQSLPSQLHSQHSFCRSSCSGEAPSVCSRTATRRTLLQPWASGAASGSLTVATLSAAASAPVAHATLPASRASISTPFTTSTVTATFLGGSPAAPEPGPCSLQVRPQHSARLHSLHSGAHAPVGSAACPIGPLTPSAEAAWYLRASAGLSPYETPDNLHACAVIATALSPHEQEPLAATHFPLRRSTGCHAAPCAGSSPAGAGSCAQPPPAVSICRSHNAHAWRSGCVYGVAPSVHSGSGILSSDSLLRPSASGPHAAAAPAGQLTPNCATSPTSITSGASPFWISGSCAQLQQPPQPHAAQPLLQQHNSCQGLPKAVAASALRAPMLAHPHPHPHPHAAPRALSDVQQLSSSYGGCGAMPPGVKTAGSAYTLVMSGCATPKGGWLAGADSAALLAGGLLDNCTADQYCGDLYLQQLHYAAAATTAAAAAAQAQAEAAQQQQQQLHAVGPCDGERFLDVLELESCFRNLRNLTFLGSGSGGSVYLGTWRSALPVAAKFMISNDVGEVARSQREAQLSRLASHPHIVQAIAIAAAPLCLHHFRRSCHGHGSSGFPGDVGGNVLLPDLLGSNLLVTDLYGLGPASSVGPRLLPPPAESICGSSCCSPGSCATLHTMTHTPGSEPPTVSTADAKAMVAATAAVAEAVAVAATPKRSSTAGTITELGATSTVIDGLGENAGMTHLSLPEIKILDHSHQPPAAAAATADAWAAPTSPSFGIYHPYVRALAAPLPARPALDVAWDADHSTGNDDVTSGLDQLIISTVASLDGYMPPPLVAGCDGNMSVAGRPTAVPSSLSEWQAIGHQAPHPGPPPPSGLPSMEQCVSPPALATAAAGQRLAAGRASGELAVAARQDSFERGDAAPGCSGAEGGYELVALELRDVLTVMGAHEGQHLTVVIMEEMDCGSLHGAVHEGVLRYPRSACLDPRHRMRAVVRTLLEVAQGMDHLHAHGLIHGDLKPANVLLKASPRDRRGFVAKVSDFGLSRSLAAGPVERAVSSADLGTVIYSAPEVFNGTSGKAADVFSFGVLLWHVVMGRLPHQGVHPFAVLLAVSKGELALEWAKPIPPPLCRLGEACTQFDPARRPSFSEIVRALLALEAEMRRRPLSTAVMAAAEAAASAAATAAGGGGVCGSV